MGNNDKSTTLNYSVVYGSVRMWTGAAGHRQLCVVTKLPNKMQQKKGGLDRTGCSTEEDNRGGHGGIKTTTQQHLAHQRFFPAKKRRKCRPATSSRAMVVAEMVRTPTKWHPIGAALPRHSRCNRAEDYHDALARVRTFGRPPVMPLQSDEIFARKACGTPSTA